MWVISATVCWMDISRCCISRATSARPCGSASITASDCTASITSVSSPRDLATLRSASTALKGPVIAVADSAASSFSSAAPSASPTMPNCRAPKRRYTPSRAMSSSWFPCSTTLPPWMTQMMSALRIVDSLCATTTHVRPTMRRSSASCTSFSLSASSDDVASSSSRILGSLRSARAMAMRCFWPPESITPRSPHCAS
mmetsp:Transcript_26930/g.54848  ORF Transcript_26930/g.54848 Transcript_26930/m.54848 type:complete len:198 (-) Transcript_26930:1723-2316(-)